MQDFGQPPRGPLKNPLDGPLEDPFEAMSGALGPDANFELFQTRLEELLMDDLGRMLNQLEDDIENSPPIPPEPQSPQLPDSLTEHLDAPPNVSSAAKQNNGQFMSEQTITDKPALPYYIEEPQGTLPPQKPPHSARGRIGRVGGRSSPGSRIGGENKTYCPLERNYVSQDYCESQDCEYYVADPENQDWCSYPEKQR